jgi:hypothetical protein
MEMSKMINRDNLQHDLNQTPEGMLAARLISAMNTADFAPYEIRDITVYNWGAVKIDVIDPFQGDYRVQVSLRTKPSY